MSRAHATARALFALSCAMLAAGCVTSGEELQPKWSATERAELHARLGVNYFQKGQLKVAQEELELALALDGNSSGAHLAMARLKTHLGDLPGARRHFEHAVRADRDHVAALNEYGYFLCANGETDAGLERLALALDHPLNPRRQVTLFGIAECRRRAGRIDEAIESYEAVLRVVPDTRAALLRLAHIHFERGAHRKARAFLERFFEDDFFTGESLFLAVRNELQLERRDLAADYARRLRTRFPDSTLVARLRALFAAQDGNGS